MSDANQQNQEQGNLLNQAGKLASMVGGHAQLANGAAQEQIGNLINSDEWKKSGGDVKGNAVDNIKEAYEDFKAQGGNDQDLVNKVGQYADKGELKHSTGVDVY